MLVSFALYALAGGLVVATILPLSTSTRWWIRLWDFPRFQLFVIGVAVLVIFSWLCAPLDLGEMLALLAVALCCGWQLSWFWRYLPVAPVEVRQSSEGEGSPAQVSLLTSNVLQSARDSDSLLRIIGEANPDVIFTVETDEWWCTRLMDGLSSRYAHRVVCPQSNGFGLAIFSRLELVEPEIRYLVDPAIPSLKTGVLLRCGAVIDLYGMHPQPPAPHHDSDERDTELILVGKEISRESRPAIVLGDLNDVAWSHTTRRFQAVGGLQDPRRGRGFFNTYPARLPGLRYPLDYIFHTSHFTIRQMKVLPKFASDHLPLRAVLCLETVEGATS